MVSIARTACISQTPVLDGSPIDERIVIVKLAPQGPYETPLVYEEAEKNTTCLESESNLQTRIQRELELITAVSSTGSPRTPLDVNACCKHMGLRSAATLGEDGP